MKLSEYCAGNPGAQRRIAEAVGVSLAFINHVVRGRKSMPVQYCFQIEKLTAGRVSRKDLRPDDWFLIWPELAD